MTIEGIVNQDFINEQVALTAQNTDGETGNFDKNLFLKILMTQLQNQSPFEPTDSSKILEQQAILTQVEQSAKQTGQLEQVQEIVDIGLGGIVTSLGQITATLNNIEAQLGGGSSGGESEGGDS